MNKNRVLPTWIDNVTPVNASNLNALVDGINGNRGDVEAISIAMTKLNESKFDKVVLSGNNLKFYAKEIEKFTIALPTGSGGREIELRKGSTHIEWRYSGESTWTQLVALVDLKGSNGVTPNITIGNVETLSPGAPATVTKRGTTEEPIFDFGIPQGKPGSGEGGSIDLSEYQKITDETLTTKDKKIVGAINEIASDTSQNKLSKYDDVSINGAELSLKANGIVKKTITLPTGGESIRNNNFYLNADIVLDITTFDGGNEPMHPKALYFEKGFGGYKFWLTYSPYTDWNELVETPCIACSNDGVNWEVPEGVINPLDQFESVATTFLSDPHLVYNSNTKYLELWYRENERGVSEKIWRRKSLNGKVWEEKELLITIPSISNKVFISPVVIYEDGKYKIWGTKEVAAARRVLTYYESVDGTNWNFIRDIDLVMDAHQIGYAISHFDIIHTKNGYELIAQDTIDNLRYIVYMKSEDNITYSEPKILMERRPTGYGYWDDERMYRPCIMLVGEEYWCYYCGSCSQPEGGTSKDRNWKTGLSILGKDIFQSNGEIKAIYDKYLNNIKTNYITNKNSKRIEILEQQLPISIKTISKFLYEDSSYIKEKDTLYVVLNTNKSLAYVDYYYGQETGGGGESQSGLISEGLTIHFDTTQSTMTQSQINDLTSNNNHGKLVGFSDKPSASGLEFTGSQFIELLNTIEFSENDYTAEFFVKLPAQADGSLFSKRYSSSNNITFGLSSTSNPTLTNRIAGIEIGTSTNRSLSVAYSPFVTDTWQHIVAIKKGVEVQIWIDGVLVNKTTSSYNLKLDETEVAKTYMGATLGNTSYLKGTMKSFKFYNRALTEKEIKSNYNYEVN